MGNGPNQALIVLLEAVGWRPEGLARRVTAELARRPGERRFVHEKTPYGWLRRGEVPRGSIPHVVVDLLSEALGEPLDFDRVWPGAPHRPSLWLPADHGLNVGWNQSGTVELLHGWVRDMLRRRGFTAISGAALTLPAWHWLETQRPVVIGPAPTAHVASIPSGLVDVIEASIGQLRGLDDVRGGGSALEYVRDQVDAVARLLREQTYNARLGKRLFVALAELAHLAGYMAYDASNHAVAQRYFLLGLRAAHTAGDRALAVNIVGIMARQATSLGQVKEALQLVNVAERGAVRSSPRVRALVQCRSAVAHAAAGDLGGFEQARAQALELLACAQQGSEAEPGWVYWLDPTSLDAQAGQGLVMLANHVHGRRERLLGEAAALLGPRAQASRGDRFQRSALLHSAWLALAHVRGREYEQAVAVGRQALARLPAVNSPRCVDLLRQVRTSLAGPARRDPNVRTFTAELDKALPAA